MDPVDKNMASDEVVDKDIVTKSVESEDTGKSKKKMATKRKSSDSETPSVCKYCKCSVKSAASLRAHYSGKHREMHAAYKKLKIDQGEEEAPLEFATPDGGTTTTPPEWVAANYHMMEEQVNGCSYTCKHCYFLGYDDGEMARHAVLMHQPEVPKTCPYCPQEKTLKSAASLRAHISACHRQEHKEAKESAKNIMASSG